MSNNFKVGEIVLAQFFEDFPEYNGEECEILNTLEFAGLILNDMSVKENVLRYRVKMRDGRVLGPLPHQLRKKLKPDEQYGDAANDYLYNLDKLAA